MERTNQCLRTTSFANAVTFEKQTMFLIFLLLFIISAEEGTCSDLSKSCNCDSKSHEPLQDTIVFSNVYLHQLPVTGLTYGPFTQQSAEVSVEIKSLECFDHGYIVKRNDCNALKAVNASRLQFNLEYLDNKNCWVEFVFQTEKDLTLTVSNFEVSSNVFTLFSMFFQLQ